MGIREQMNEKPGLTAGVVGGIIVLVLIYVFWNSGGSSTPTAGGGGTPEKAFYTDDDGKTWFTDDAKKVPPFDRGGKQAVQAYVFSADGKEFVNHMRRFTPEAKKKVEEMMNNPRLRNDPTMLQSIQAGGGEEVKKPADAKWIKVTDPKYIEVIRPKPEGAEAVYP